MGKFFRFKQKIIAAGIVFSIISAAIVFSILLGKYYLHSVIKDYPVTRSVYRKVYYPVAIKTLRLQPVAIYTFQAGVFTDRAGATQLAATLVEKGLRPCISPITPYKVFIFAAPTREKLLKFKGFVTDDAFVANEILNADEIELREDKIFWFNFLPQFTELFSQTLIAFAENDNIKDQQLSEAWQKCADELSKQNKNEKKGSELITAFGSDAALMSKLLLSPRTTLEEQGKYGELILKTKFDYDYIRHFLSSFE